MRRESTAGFALLDVLIATVVAVSIAGMAVPLTSRVSDDWRARAAAGYLAGRLRLARLQAVASGDATAMVFDRAADGGWQFVLCADRNGNGVRRADVAAGRDACDAVPTRLGDLFAGVALGLAAGVPNLDGEPGADGVVFGTSRMASCTAVGHCTPGTLYVQSPGGRQYAVRVSGVTGRTRLYRFDPGAGRWGEH